MHSINISKKEYLFHFFEKINDKIDNVWILFSTSIIRILKLLKRKVILAD